MNLTLLIPPLERIGGRLLGSPVQRFIFPQISVTGNVTAFKHGVIQGHTFTPAEEGICPTFVVLRKSSSSRKLPDHVLISKTGLPTELDAIESCRWLHPKTDGLHKSLVKADAHVDEIRDSWRDQFLYKSERRVKDKIIEPGLRPPQIGALHAILAHWTVSEDPATVVMPTGTGKTETMLALLVAERLKRVLVIVPTDSLREQIAGKFLSLGILRDAGVLGPKALLPVVGTLLHKPRTIKEAEDFFRRCNVIVTTASIAGDCSDVVSKLMASACSHLFVDEAHHVRAPSWSRIRSCFAGKPVVQFTATPYRGDGKLVDGKAVYNYPLKKAQKEGYFKSIRFKGIEEYNDEKSDEAIAVEAVKQLDEDLKAGFDHLLMARCATIDRAREVFALYTKIAPTHNPVIAHSELSNHEKSDSVRRLRNRASRIVVCVDMFGEGFDLPELKIAGLHDIHKSLTVTLQFTGRFTRTNANVGEATVVANIADTEVEEALQALYGEDPDWNYLLQDLSAQASGQHVSRTEFVKGFNERPDNIPIQNIFPKMSTVVYETKCQKWKPDRVKRSLRHIYDKPAFNPKEQVAAVITKEFQPVGWGDVRGINDVVYHLYLLHWDIKQNLLYIHSSNNGSTYLGLAKAVCGEDVVPIKGERVFRVLGEVNRLILMNLGLSHTFSRAVSFTMLVGPDIREGWTAASAQNKFKTNVFGRGYEGGSRANVGCSAKGRIWSQRVSSDIGEWVSWCHEMGRKLKDDKIDVRKVIEGSMVPKIINGRPTAVPLNIEWPDEVLQRSEEAVTLELAGVSVPFYDVSFEITTFKDQGPLGFQVRCDGWQAKTAAYELKFANDRLDYMPLKSVEPQIAIGKRRLPLSQFFQDEPPKIHFHDGSMLWYTNLLTPPGTRPVPYDRSKIEAWPWTGVDLSKESQKQEKRSDSIQRHVIESLLAEKGDSTFDIVFDDDESGESADIVAIRVEKTRILFRLYHCKYAKNRHVGAQVQDLYEVCGQAQTSVHWKSRHEEFIDHLLHREAKRTSKGGVSRFDRGDVKALKVIRRRLRSLRPDFEIYIVQPALSRAKAGADHLELFAVTELHLQQTHNVPLYVITSA